MIQDFCPNCGTNTIVNYKCRGCQRDFHTGYLVNKIVKMKRRYSSIAIPTVREALPNHVAYALRDKLPQRNRCGIRYQKGRHSI